MAQVSMTGNEYAELLQHGKNEEQLQNTILSQHRVLFNSNRINNQAYVEPEKNYPADVIAMIMRYVSRQVGENDAVLATLHENRQHYYDVYSNYFYDYEYERTFDILKYNGILSRKWAEMDKAAQKKAEEEAAKAKLEEEQNNVEQDNA